MGHYLSAMSMQFANTKDLAVLDKIDYAVSELQTCQMENGFLFTKPEEQFDKMENNQKTLKHHSYEHFVCLQQR